MFARADNPCRIFVEDGKETSKMLQTCYKYVSELLLTKLLLILEKKSAYVCIMFAQTKKISRLCVIFLKKYLEISTENYTFANVILNTIFYLKKTNTYWWSASRCEVRGIRFLYRFYLVFFYTSFGFINDKMTKFFKI